MKRLILGLLLAVSLTAAALALEVPTETIIQELNGSQQLIKTYTLAPDIDPQELVESPFEQEGYLYTFANIIKEENRKTDTSSKSETATLETTTDNLADILAELPSAREYDDGTYIGTLALDCSSIRTEASGYTSKTRTVSATRTIGPVDRNDMSYVPATTVKDGVTLKLSGVEWQVTGSDVVGDSLAPASYQAVATYTGKSSYSVATGYITTAEYTGTVASDRVESITYRVTYLGTETEEAPEEQPAPAQEPSLVSRARTALPQVAAALAVLAILTLTLLLVRTRRELRQFHRDEPEETDEVQEVEHNELA